VVVGKGLLPDFGPARRKFRRIVGGVNCDFCMAGLRRRGTSFACGRISLRFQGFGRRGAENLGRGEDTLKLKIWGGVFAAGLCEGCEGSLALSSQGKPLILLGL
jgi:hypothetical protein